MVSRDILSRNNPFEAWMEYLIYALVIILPLIISRSTYDQYDIVKMEIFRVVSVLILVLWLVRIFTAKKVRIVWTKWDLFLLGFLALALVSTFTSIHVFSSLQGKYKRYEGLYTFLNYAAIYFLAMQIFKGKEQIARLSRFISYTAMAVAAYGLIQYIGLDPINWGATPFNARSSFSTFGNPDLLGAYLALTLPITLANFINSKDQVKTAVFGLGYFLVAASLLTTYTRGAWLGGIFGVIVLLSLIGYKHIKANLRKLVVVHLIFLTFFAGVLVYSSTTARPGVMNLSSRIKSATKLSSGTVGSRIEIWKAGLAMIKDRPLLGQGLGTYRMASEHFETLKYVKMVKGRVVSDNAHNYLVQITASTGIPAALLFFTFMLGIFYISVTSIRRRQKNESISEDDGSLALSGLSAGALGYFVYLLAGISVVGSSAILWVILAVLIGQTKWRITWEREQQQAYPISASLGAVLILAMFLGTFTFSKMLIGDNYIVRFYRLSGVGLYDQAFAIGEDAFSLYPNARYQVDIGQFYARFEPSIENNRHSMDAFKKAIEAEPLENDARVFLADTYNVTYLMTGNSDNLRLALDEIKKVKAQRPHSFPGNFLLGKFYMEEKNYNKAIKYFLEAESINPDFANIDVSLSQAYKLSGNKKMADYYKRKAAAKK